MRGMWVCNDGGIVDDTHKEQGREEDKLGRTKERKKGRKKE